MEKMKKIMPDCDAAESSLSEINHDGKTDFLAMDYCGFRLKSLAEKIKSGYLKFKKSNIDLINP